MTFTLFKLKVMRKLGLLRFLHPTMTVRHERGQFRIPIWGNTGFENIAALTTAEPWLDRILARVLEDRPGLIVDVGVNVGQTLLKIKRLRPDQAYLGFEPNPSCCAYVERLIAVNGFKHCELVPAALGREAGVFELFIRSDADSGASLVKGFRDAKFYSARKWVAVLHGDAVLRSVDAENISLVKIDVEGGEVDVIEGLLETLDRQRPAVVCEILPVPDRASDVGRMCQERQDRQDRLLQLLRQRGYQLCRILPDDARLQPLADIEPHNDLSRTNYLFVPPDRKHLIA